MKNILVDLRQLGDRNALLLFALEQSQEVMRESAHLDHMGQHDGAERPFAYYVDNATQCLNKILETSKSVVGDAALLTKMRVIGGNELV